MEDSYKIATYPDSRVLYSNAVFMHPTDYKLVQHRGKYVQIMAENRFCYVLEAHPKLQRGEIALSQLQRKEVYVAINDEVRLSFHEDATEIATIIISINFRKKKSSNQDKVLVNADELIEKFAFDYKDHVFSTTQSLYLKIEGIHYVLTIQSLVGISNVLDTFGKLTTQSEIQLSSEDVAIALTNMDGEITGSKTKRTPIKFEMDFEKLQVGGLGKEYRTLHRRAFGSRCISDATAKMLGVKHNKGILLYGPPGTGKTLLARQIGSLLTERKAKKITGSEVLSKWVGVAEEKIRELFEEAEQEYQEKGDDSSLHVIIIDELDAICRARGSSRNNVGDSIVNQLLTKMDGLEKIENVMVIGMTNRKELIDSALLRPGRFDVKLEIGLPDERGRYEILLIHTSQLRKFHRLEADVDLEDIAKITKNFTGAEIQGLVSIAVANAIDRQIDHSSENREVDEDSILVSWNDFRRAMTELTPAFGVNADEVSELLPPVFIEYDGLSEAMHICRQYTDQLIQSPLQGIFSLLITGSRGSGKTTMAVKLATEGDFPLVKVISGEEFIGDTDLIKASKIQDLFRQLYKSPLSVLVIDQIEQILSYSSNGQRYDNAVLQCLLLCLSKRPPKRRKLFIIGTTSDKTCLKSLRLTESFTKIIEMPELVQGPIRDIISDLEFMRVNSPEQFTNELENLGEEWSSMADIPPYQSIEEESSDE
eukprot:TRINITY_DN9362_c0_g1_i1.p1 TRINITY_DN9362_c0_g1~~TRINITY_DN9362_c0_g1_i1.p1  ORF type:complete len:708 (+),score=176.42 TRINITY_DN9362_c0_g1_i1:55-2178(+)